MKILCRLRYHRWNRWSMTPTSRSSPDKSGWCCAQMRQCYDCYEVQTRELAKGFAINFRPLRTVVAAHIEDLRRCVTAFDESGLDFEKTAKEIEIAIQELSTALEIDTAALRDKKKENQ